MRIKEIEARLGQLSGAAFHQLCDRLLAELGIGYASGSGRIPGQDKDRKGIPDSYVLLPNGKFLFMECTTQKNSLKEKLSRDIQNALDPAKSNICTKKIDQVVRTGRI